MNNRYTNKNVSLKKFNCHILETVYLSSVIALNLQQSRCAMIRYGKLNDAQILKKIIEVCGLENVSYTDEGLEAVVFTAQGDMRQVT